MFRSNDSQGKPRYVGTSRASVLDNRDPDNRGRIQVNHGVIGLTSWIPYLNSPGMFSVPSVKDIVFVTCESGDPEYAYAWGNITKGIKAKPDIPDIFKRDVPTNRGLYSPGGHTIELDDGEAKSSADPNYNNLSTTHRGIRITSKSGHTIAIYDDPDGGIESITIIDKSQDGIIFNSKEKKVTLVSKGQMQITADETLTITANKDILVKAVNDQEVHDVQKFIVSATGDMQATSGANATFSGTSKTTLGDAGSPTNVDGTMIKLAGGGPGIARLGDRSFGIGNLGAPVSSTIIQGSTKVFSG